MEICSNQWLLSTTNQCSQAKYVCEVSANKRLRREEDKKVPMQGLRFHRGFHTDCFLSIGSQKQKRTVFLTFYYFLGKLPPPRPHTLPQPFDVDRVRRMPTVLPIIGEGYVLDKYPGNLTLFISLRLPHIPILLSQTVYIKHAITSSSCSRTRWRPSGHGRPSEWLSRQCPPVLRGGQKTH
jgi:hypothetical protein